MSLENAKLFLENLNTNEQVMEKLKTISLEDTDQTPELAAIARNSGYDVTDGEMEEFLAKAIQKRKKDTDAAAIKIAMIDDDELEAVAGGGDHDTCSDTYKDDENCWNNDSCKHVINMYCAQNDSICDSYAFCESVTMHQ